MFSLYDKIIHHPEYYRQLSCGDSLMTLFDCPLPNKFEDAWSHYNYVVYVVEGRKIWHTAHGSYDLKKGDCAFIRKGAYVIEQFFEANGCFIIFFMPDEFIRESLQHSSLPIPNTGHSNNTVLPIENNTMVQSFFQSITSYFYDLRDPDMALLELKFRELVLTIAGNKANSELIAYLHSLLKQPHFISLQQVMVENFCYNLKLEEFARLSARSLSAFKRDFMNIYGITPGKWLKEKRLTFAHHLITNLGKSVRDAAFESGFENPSHFSRAFRKHFGTTPAAVKQQPVI